MERLWAPWRMTYIEKASEAERDGGCFLCAAGEPASPDPLAVELRDLTVAVLNRFPYNSGHLMVCPRRHIGTMTEASAEEGAALFAATQRALRALGAVYAPEGFNIGVNQGASAGGTVADHLHIHVVPRWAGDTNFMPVVGDAKVLPEALDASAARLRAAFAALPAG